MVSLWFVFCVIFVRVFRVFRLFLRAFCLFLAHLWSICVPLLPGASPRKQSDKAPQAHHGRIPQLPRSEAEGIPRTPAEFGIFISATPGPNRRCRRGGGTSLTRQTGFCKVWREVRASPDSLTGAAWQRSAAGGISGLARTSVAPSPISLNLRSRLYTLSFQHYESALPDRKWAVAPQYTPFVSPRVLARKRGEGEPVRRATEAF